MVLFTGRTVEEAIEKEIQSKEAAEDMQAE